VAAMVGKLAAATVSLQYSSLYLIQILFDALTYRALG